MHFTKMHGAGNSFVLVDNMKGELAGVSLPRLAAAACARHTGLSADGMIVVAPAPAGSEADFAMLFYNSDGTLGEMCGNGARCICRYGFEHGYAKDASSIRCLATAGVVSGRRITAEQYEVRLNDPTVIDLHRCVSAAGEEFDCAYVELGSPGIPHAIVEVEESVFADLDAMRRTGCLLRNHPAFPKGANVTFAALRADGTVRALTYERGVEDFTLACGTGCGSTTVALLLRGRIPASSLQIDMPGGRLSVNAEADAAAGKACNIYLTGPTAIVAEGEYNNY